MLAGLEADGYVKRAEVPGDGRRALISAAPKARTVGRRFDLYDDAMRETVAGFDAAEVAVIARYWASLLDNVNRRTADPGTRAGRD